MLSNVDADEVSPVNRAANRRRFALLKEDAMPDAELLDMLATPWEHEGAMIDALRAEGADESVQKAMLAVVRLSKSIEEDLPESIREVVGQLAELSKADPDNDDDEDCDEVVKAAGDGEAGEATAHVKARAKAPSGSKLSPKNWLKKAEAVEVEDQIAAEEDTVTKEDTVAEPTETPLAVPVQKEDGTWDLSGVPEDQRGFYTTVLKSNETLATELEAARERITKAEDELRDREFIAKADEKFDVLAPAAELGPVLKAAAAGMPEESYSKLEEILTSASERVRKGDLFEEKGKAALSDGHSSNAYDTAVEKAKELVEKSDELTEDQALARVFKENPELYGKYLEESFGGVA